MNLEKINEIISSSDEGVKLPWIEVGHPHQVSNRWIGKDAKLPKNQGYIRLTTEDGNSINVYRFDNNRNLLYSAQFSHDCPELPIDCFISGAVGHADIQALIIEDEDCPASATSVPTA